MYVCVRACVYVYVYITYIWVPSPGGATEPPSLNLANFCRENKLQNIISKTMCFRLLQQQNSGAYFVCDYKCILNGRPKKVIH